MNLTKKKKRAILKGFGKTGKELNFHMKVLAGACLDMAKSTSELNDIIKSIKH